MALLVLFVACAALIGGPDTTPPREVPEETTVVVEKTVEKTVETTVAQPPAALPKPKKLEPKEEPKPAPQPKPEPQPEPESEPDPLPEADIPAAPATPTPPVGSGKGGRLTCADFSTEAEASAAIPSNPQLDRDGDGRACETLP